MAFIFVLFQIIILIIRAITGPTLYKEVNIDRIKPGMIPAGLKGNWYAEGLTDDHINLMKQKGLEEITVHQTTKFAPSLFIGTLLTFILQGNMLTYLILLL